MVNIEIDGKKCTDPYNCKKCLQVCPPAVFGIFPTNREIGKKSREWTLTAVFEELCDACGKCTEVCDKKAIAIDKNAAPQNYIVKMIENIIEEDRDV